VDAGVAGIVAGIVAGNAEAAAAHAMAKPKPIRQNLVLSMIKSLTHEPENGFKNMAPMFIALLIFGDAFACQTA
jgi:hypothetical protein